MKKITIHIKPHIQGCDNGIHKIKPTYSISKVALIDGKLVYVADHRGVPVYIPRRWVQKRVLS